MARQGVCTMCGEVKELVAEPLFPGLETCEACAAEIENYLTEPREEDYEYATRMEA